MKITKSTKILIDNNTPEYKRIPSSEILMQWACYPLTKSIHNLYVTEMRMAIHIDGNVTDVILQNWHHDGNSTPDLDLAIHAIDLESISRGWESDDDCLKDLIEGKEDVSGLKSVEISLELSFDNEN